MTERKTVKKAVAVQYDPELAEAPLVKAKGEGFVAEQILEVAKSHSIPIYEDPSLVELLSKIELNEQIPEELYEVMAEILAMVYQMDKRVQQIDQPKGKDVHLKKKGSPDEKKHWNGQQ